MNNPKVSVIIPCYNQGDTITETINSVLVQTMQDFEIIIVNDGSTDCRTNELLSRANWPKTICFQTENQGLASARNFAIAQSKGEYILPLDSDDTIAPEYLFRALSEYEKNDRLGIVYCKAMLFGAMNGMWKLPDYSLDKMLISNVIFCSAVFKKSDWQKVGGYCIEMRKGFEDWDFWLSLIELGREVYQIPETLFRYRVKKRSMASSLRDNLQLRTSIQTLLFRRHNKIFTANIHCILEELNRLRYLEQSIGYKTYSRLIRLLPFSKSFLKH